MAPFIKHTETVNSADGTAQRFHFLNVELVTRAVFDTRKNTLDVVVASGDDKATYTLQGDEATAAMEIIRAIK